VDGIQERPTDVVEIADAANPDGGVGAPDTPPLHGTPLTVNAVGTAFEPVKLAKNPRPVTLPPAGMVPLYDALTTVTIEPACENTPFQPLVTA
jgi:hypothetical protein